MKVIKGKTKVTVTGSLPAFAANPSVIPVTSAGAQVTGATAAAVPAGAVQIAGTDGTNLRTPGALQLLNTINGAGATYGLVVKSAQMGYNETSYEPWRNNTEGTLLASAARTATTTAANLTNHNGKSIQVHLDVSAASGTGGLQVRIRVVDPISLNSIQINATPTAITAAGSYTYEVSLGGATAGVAGNGLVNQRTQGMIGRTISVQVGVGDASSYTYSVGYSLSV